MDCSLYRMIFCASRKFTKLYKVDEFALDVFQLLDGCFLAFRKHSLNAVHRALELSESFTLSSDTAHSKLFRDLSMD